MSKMILTSADNNIPTTEKRLCLDEKRNKEYQRKKKRRERIIKAIKLLKGSYDDSLSTEDLEDRLSELEDLIEDKDEDKSYILDKDQYEHYRE